MVETSGIIDQLWEVWLRLKRHWEPYFKKANLDLSGATRENFQELLTKRIEINFDVPGLEDLSRECCKGITPGDPALSLFYHVLASPHAIPAGIKSNSKNYPSIGDLEIIENFVYAAANMNMRRLRKMAREANGGELAIVVFAYEYAPLEETVHKRHADLCFSRTCISRIGNAEPAYDHEARGFFPFSKPGRIHVVPARFGAFFACRVNGDPGTIGPLHPLRGDRQKQFWVPLHKIFAGRECLEEFDIKLSFDVKHRNEKIRRVHRELKLQGVRTRWSEEQMTRYPFVVTDELANFCDRQGLVIPVAHDRLVSPAEITKGNYVGFRVPEGNKGRLLDSSFWLKPGENGRPCPEFVHIRHKIVGKSGGKQKIVYLPKASGKDIKAILEEGGFQAANFVDWTGDGYIKAKCGLRSKGSKTKKRQFRSLAAYSILAQPDFFPLVTQQGLTSWWKDSEVREFVWANDNGILPDPLSDKRLAANLTLEEAKFDRADNTMTAIVGLYRKPSPRQSRFDVRHDVRDQPRRVSTLSYRSSSLFDPGWDISEDLLQRAGLDETIPYMANYGLGSPFPEDTLICSALGAFWPGAAPDITRFFEPQGYATTTPLLDAEVKGWAGAERPKIKGKTIAYQALAYADYVRAVYKKKLAYDRFAKVSLPEFILRTEIMARFYQWVGTRDGKDTTRLDNRTEYVIKSFKRASESEIKTLKGWMIPPEHTFRIEFFKRPDDKRPKKGITGKKPAMKGVQPATDPRTTRIDLGKLRVVYLGPSHGPIHGPREVSSRT